MDKNSIIISLSIVGLVALGGIGYAVWSTSQTPQVAVQQTPENTTNSTNTTNLVAQAGAPIVQTDSISAPYISTVVTKGTVNPNGAITTYWYEYGKTVALGSQTPNYLIGSGFTKMYTPAYITGLQANTDYYFRLSANNSFGTIHGITYTFKTNTTPPPEGTAPTTSTQNATDITRTTVNLNGKINPNGAQSTFWFEYGSSSNLGSVTSFQSTNDSKSSSDVSVSISNLQPLTKYFFRLNAQNQFGTINGQILNFTTLGPVQATIPKVNTTSATNITNSSAKLNAGVNPNGAQTTYWFEYSNNSFLPDDKILNTQEQSLTDSAFNINVSATIDNLDNNTKYYIRVAAKNRYGTVRGDMVSFTTKK
ncbi:MAG: hypothetical protein A2908_00095 [Candidatus Staskawiczbacteria bacterium RIFCSPLOWO2_01_FULL_38_12b]|uniref:Fibronectin type-III domain-containing protein n=1 Tax=Candidatus Staskawiczbacteria bacterium RIFCSPLOWO2_01_FULL_38_12b TaxID=1802214 RepID=A0A1G2IE91_9BACT|nr:MAG: hypothetical protein A2908_00095 [Candidatus Staskawiczbacteria bacterium RIFCSPLOWO2_01_FULL_38_12b]